MASSPLPAAIDWDALDALKFADERTAAPALADAVGMCPATRAAAADAALALVEGARRTQRAGLLEGFLQTFGLTNREGLALMCLAEALLRVPDAPTADALIAEKLSAGAWAEHAWKSDHWLVNASTLGLMLGRSLGESGGESGAGAPIDLDASAKRDPASYFRRLTGRLGEPVIRAAMRQAMRVLGEQFVLGRTLDAARARGRAGPATATGGPLFSFDMLGEGARTDADAQRYQARYLAAIAAVAAHRQAGAVEQVDGVSVKLSALHPRYQAVHEATVMAVLYPRLLEQAEAARAADIGLCIDAEEADRLVLSLKLVERLAQAPSLAGWHGLGLAVQAYQKRAQALIEYLIALAAASGRRLMVRLVKGAYWDTEIKLAQQAGHPDYPVWTTKTATDLNYLACARLLLQAPGALFPQFATHNAHTLAAVRELARAHGNPPYEFQRLHGMGEALYSAAAAADTGLARVRVYAPVGSHAELLPYLVRRLLENGANTSFVYRLLDPAVPASALATGPFAAASDLDRHPRIPPPPALYGAARVNAPGTDLTQAAVRARLATLQRRCDSDLPWACGPVIAGQVRTGAGTKLASPADHDCIVAEVRSASTADIDAAYAAARAAQPGWNRLGGWRRAATLRAMADALAADRDWLLALMARETGKTRADGIGEVREAIDFLRYYAAAAETEFGAPRPLPGPAGETNQLELTGRGVFVCISPWNFPLAIFTGQIAAALAAGNTVLAKPAEQAPLTAFMAMQRFLQAGLPASVLHLLPGDGAVGAALTALPQIDGVAFTGSFAVAQSINRTLAAKAGPIVPLIAETGGLNAMFADSSALAEQLIDDTLLSAFGAAGQRCSALRLLLVPQASAAALIARLQGAMDALVIGDPADPATDLGPVIDADAQAMLSAHLRAIQARGGRLLHRAPLAAEVAARGRFFAPALVEVERIEQVGQETFGPILHLLRYRPEALPALAGQLAATGYGLTLGVHSRLERFVETVRAAVPAGNVYVNRSMIGAVVGVQPFGGTGRSGTGPKAGGPQTLQRFATERTLTVNIAAQGGDPHLLSLD